MTSLDHSFSKDEDFGTEWHRIQREEGWVGGLFVELPYFLSCVCRTTYYGLPREEWEPALRLHIAQSFPQAKWILDSSYFYNFSLLLLKELYRKSDLGSRYPIANEKKRDSAARFALLHSNLSLEQMAHEIGTTLKQLERNCDVRLALTEYKRVVAKRPS